MHFTCIWPNLTQRNNQWEESFSLDVGPNANEMDYMITNIAFEMGTCLQRLDGQLQYKSWESLPLGSRELEPTY